MVLDESVTLNIKSVFECHASLTNFLRDPHNILKVISDLLCHAPAINFDINVSMNKSCFITTEDKWLFVKLCKSKASGQIIHLRSKTILQFILVLFQNENKFQFIENQHKIVFIFVCNPLVKIETIVWKGFVSNATDVYATYSRID